MKSLPKLLWAFLFLLLSAAASAQDTSAVTVFKMDIKADIDPRTNRYVKLALEEAEKLNVDYVLIEMNTYGGAVNDADEIRQRLLEFPKPIMVFINKNAASAGALISIACDSIYMAPGATIGAATVVSADGQAASGKYQSYMRSMMRSTATTNNRNPTLAEAMVDANVKGDTILQAGQVLTLTTEEAIRYGFCEGVAVNANAALANAGLSDAVVINYSLSTTDKIIAFFLNPFISGILLLIILGGLYFELQTPGIGFPLGAAILAGVFYLVPYYLHGLAANWEILALVIGLILLVLELLIIPGFGIAGISGILLILVSLVLIMLNNYTFDFTFVSSESLLKSLSAVTAGLIGAIVLAALTWNKIAASKTMQRMVLQNTFNSREGYRSATVTEQLVGKSGVAYTRLSPSGRIIIEDTIYEAQAREGYIEKDEPVTVIGQSLNILKVKKAV